MFVVVNKIEGPPAELDRIHHAFRERASDMRQFEGFLGLEVWRDEQKRHLCAISRWTSREAFLAYPASDLFRQHHKGRSGSEAMKIANLTMYEAETLV